MKSWLSRLELRSADRETSSIVWSRQTLLIALFVIIFVFWLKAFKVVSNPQFWAEDGVVFFKDAFEMGLGSIFHVQAGYYVVLIRIIAWISTLFVLKHAPLICALGSLLLQLMPLYLILSKRLSHVFPHPVTRMIFALVYIAGPGSYEIFGVVTNVQWYLPVWTILLFFATPSEHKYVRVIEYILLVLINLTGPFVIFLFPLYLLLSAMKALKVDYVVIAILLVTFSLQAYSVFTTPQVSSVIDVWLLLKYYSSKVILNGLIGIHGHRIEFNAAPPRAFMVMGLLIWIYTSARILLSGNNFYRLLLVVSNVIFVAGVRKVGAYFSLDPEVGARYAWFALTMYVAMYGYIACTTKIVVERWLFRGLLFCTMFFAIPLDLELFNPKTQNWRYQVKGFRWLEKGDTLRINVDPVPWNFDLIKSTPSDIHNYEENDAITATLLFTIQDHVLTTQDAWAFLNSDVAAGNEVSIVLKSPDRLYVIPCETQSRPDVSAVYKNNYDDAGFAVSKNIRKIKDGKYELGLFVYNRRTNRHGLKQLTTDFILDQSSMKAGEVRSYRF
jgi:hypothetical protein